MGSMVQPQQRIGEYVLQERIGGGAFGEVWRAHHHVWTDQLVAIKFPADPQYLRDLQREGVALHGLVHPNIVRAIGFDPYSPVPYLTMEYVPGTSLRPLIPNRSVSIADAVAILKQVLTGLKFAHEHGVVHRDIKPENVLVHERAWKEGFGVEGVVKLTDFGLGRADGRASGDSIAFSASLSGPTGRQIAGTLDYMAPEQRQGDGGDARADLYACGVVLYELLTGQRPAGTEVPSDRNRSVPAALDNVFRRSYARLDKRFASADEFLSALSLASPAAGPTVPVRPPPLPSRYVPYPQRPAAASITCPQCRKQVDARDQFCMHCGVQLVPEVRRCPRCGAYPDVYDRHCIFCGEALTPAAVIV